MSVRIGDGTAPIGWPAYTATWDAEGKVSGVRCRFNNCNHTGTLGTPSVMECGKNCACSCCRLLAGATEHGLAYGRRP